MTTGDRIKLLNKPDNMANDHIAKADNNAQDRPKTIDSLADEMLGLSIGADTEDDNRPTSLLDLFMHEPVASQICKEV